MRQKDPFVRQLNDLMKRIQKHGVEGLSRGITKEEHKEINSLLRVMEEHLVAEEIENSKTVIDKDASTTLKDQHERVMKLLASDDEDVVLPESKSKQRKKKDTTDDENDSHSWSTW